MAEASRAQSRNEESTHCPRPHRDSSLLHKGRCRWELQKPLASAVSVNIHTLLAFLPFRWLSRSLKHVSSPNPALLSREAKDWPSTGAWTALPSSEGTEAWQRRGPAGAPVLDLCYRARGLQRSKMHPHKGQGAPWCLSVLMSSGW